MTATISEIEQELFEAHKFEIICQPSKIECDKKAEIVVVSTCGCEYPLCGPHAAVVMNFLARYDNLAICTICDVSSEVEFVPIGA